MRKWPVVGVVLAVLWLFVRGVDLALDPILAEFIIGLMVGLPVAFALRAYYTPQVQVLRAVRVAHYAVLYVLVFLWELLTANVDVAYRVLAPSLPIEPAVVEVPLRVETDAAITSIANSITLTPGTLTMDYDDASNTLYVHAIMGGNREAVVDPIRTWEDYALAIFDEPADPGDPVPPRPGREGGADGGDADGR